MVCLVHLSQDILTSIQIHGDQEFMVGLTLLVLMLNSECFPKVTVRHNHLTLMPCTKTSKPRLQHGFKMQRVGMVGKANQWEKRMVMQLWLLRGYAKIFTDVATDWGKDSVREFFHSRFNAVFCFVFFLVQKCLC